MAVRNAEVLRTDAERNVPAPSGYGISKVRRLYRAANNNERGQDRTAAPAATARPLPNPSNTPLPERGETRKVIGKGLALVNAMAAVWFIIGTTWIFYLIQFVFAFLYLMALGGLMAYEDSWWDFFDIFGWGSSAGSGVLILCLGLALTAWLFTFLAATIIFWIRGVKMMGGASIILAALSLTFTAAPLMGLVPWVWVWCAYVAKSQIDEPAS